MVYSYVYRIKYLNNNACELKGMFYHHSFFRNELLNQSVQTYFDQFSALILTLQNILNSVVT